MRRWAEVRMRAAATAAYDDAKLPSLSATNIAILPPHWYDHTIWWPVGTAPCGYIWHSAHIHGIIQYMCSAHH